MKGCGTVRAIVVFFAIVQSTSAVELGVGTNANRFPFSLTFDAVPGMFYDIETSTNLFSWDLAKTIRPASASAVWTDTNESILPARYYRIADLSANIVVEGDVRWPTADGAAGTFHSGFVVAGFIDHLH